MNFVELAFDDENQMAVNAHFRRLVDKGEKLRVGYALGLYDYNQEALKRLKKLINNGS